MFRLTFSITKGGSLHEYLFSKYGTNSHLYGALMQMVDILACHARYTGSSPVGVAIGFKCELT